MEHNIATINLGPQLGPQSQFLASLADIAIYGGAAGGGKTYSLLLDPLRHYNNSRFNGVIFRRETPQITNPGGLWDEAVNLYAPIPAKLNLTALTCEFPSGMKMKFAHLEQEKTIYNWQGSQIPYIGFDELTHFTEKQFFYMLSRNRSTSGAAPRIRATTNPDPDSFVRKLIDWWIDSEGYPIPERSGKLRYFTRENDEIIWHDTKVSEFAKSITFIGAKLDDNQILVRRDPSYKANLMALSYVDRMRLLNGNWNIRPDAGLYFKRHYFSVIGALPTKTRTVRYWDRAATKNEGSDYTVGVKMHRTEQGEIIVSDMRRFRGTPMEVRNAIRNTTVQDGVTCIVGIEQDPGQAGLVEAEDYVRLLSGFVVKLLKVSTDKITRASPFSSQCEAGNVKILKGDWNDAFLSELESFPKGKFDDVVDSASGAFNLLTQGLSGVFTKEMAAVKISRERPTW